METTHTSTININDGLKKMKLSFNFQKQYVQNIFSVLANNNPNDYDAKLLLTGVNDFIQTFGIPFVLLISDQDFLTVLISMFYEGGENFKTICNLYC